MRILGILATTTGFAIQVHMGPSEHLGPSRRRWPPNGREGIATSPMDPQQRAHYCVTGERASPEESDTCSARCEGKLSYGQRAE